VQRHAATPQLPLLFQQGQQGTLCGLLRVQKLLVQGGGLLLNALDQR
jgi:hypothetical protein